MAGSLLNKDARATADAAYDYLVVKRKVDPKRMISAGWSLGGAVAIDLAARRRVGGLIAFSTFTSAVEVARGKLPFVPVSLLLQPRFESLRKIATIRCPILIGHGRRDSIIPFWMSEELAASAGGPVTTVWIEIAAHKHFFENGGRQIDEAIARFLEALISLGTGPLTPALSPREREPVPSSARGCASRPNWLPLPVREGASTE